MQRDGALRWERHAAVVTLHSTPFTDPFEELWKAIPQWGVEWVNGGEEKTRFPGLQSMR